MSISIRELEELVGIREKVRRSIESLEFCWSCECIAECRPQLVDDGPEVWLCGCCEERLHSKSTLGDNVPSVYAPLN